ncbi:hypothetical protein [Glaciimonas sp. PCH181]|uniref:hypothetical protein n=1 Tax=Glaciimonas sp. PCH181 TaxID=2133943 RepID=UPI000D3D40AE|nr:hypothetical protein [Glaciimonas sp. PCH181]PUA16742.1 hypothetical protein C7W93_22400 [Glaciimonas sp. PCH181]
MGKKTMKNKPEIRAAAILAVCDDFSLNHPIWRVVNIDTKRRAVKLARILVNKNYFHDCQSQYFNANIGASLGE